MDLHLVRQLVLSLEFSTQHRRIEKMERKMTELHDQKESLQNNYEALQNTNGLLRDMVEEAKRGHALQVQETIKTEMMMGDAVATLDAKLVETTGKAIQVRMPSCANRSQIWRRLSQQTRSVPMIRGPSSRKRNPPSPPLQLRRSCLRPTRLSSRLRRPSSGKRPLTPLLRDSTWPSSKLSASSRRLTTLSSLSTSKWWTARSFALDHLLSCLYPFVHKTLNVKTLHAYIKCHFFSYRPSCCASLILYLLSCMTNC